MSEEARYNAQSPDSGEILNNSAIQASDATGQEAATFDRLPDFWERLAGKFRSNNSLALILKPLDLFSLFRPLLVVAGLLPALLGFLASGYIDAIIGDEETKMDPTGLSSLALPIFLLCASVFIINQIYDKDADKKGKKHLPIAEGLISVRLAWIVYYIVSIIAAAIAFAHGILPGILVIVGIGLGLLYSLPQVSLKDKPWAGLLLNGLGHGYLVYLIGFLWSTPIAWKPFVTGIPFIFAYAGVYLFTTIPDMNQDKVFGKRTFAVVFGQRKAAGLALGLILLTTGIGILFEQPALFLTGLFSLPFYIYSFLKGHGHNNAAMTSVILLTIFASFYYFWPFPLAVVVAAIVWFHNRMRYGVSYP